MAIYTEKQKARKKELAKIRYARDREKMKSYSRAWAINNPERAKLISIKSKKKNVKKEVEYQRNRRKKDKRYSELNRIRVGFRAMVRGRQQVCSVSKYIGLDRKDFLRLIESKFKKGMSWDTVQIDHYVPIKCFDLFNDIEMRIAWNIDNLNPLTAEENKSKNSKIPEDANRHIDNICKKIGIKYEFKQLG